MISFNTNIKTFEDANKALQEIKNQLNIMLERLGEGDFKEESETEGIIGDIRIIRNAENQNTFEIKTEEGWQKPVVGETLVSFKNQDETSKSPAKKSIDELEVTDTTTGDKVAKKTIFDEKAGKFVLPRADYDSGWIATAGVTLDHNLETENFSLCQIFHNNDPDNISNRLINQGIVSVNTVNENQIAVSVIGVSIGYTRIRLWK